MSAKYIQPGEALDYTAAQAVKNGDIVSLNTRIGIVAGDIPAGGTGTVHVTGVFELPKGAEAITLGAAVYWDAANEAITTTAGGNIPVGYAVAAVDADVSVAAVKLLG